MRGYLKSDYPHGLRSRLREDILVEATHLEKLGESDALYAATIAPLQARKGANMESLSSVLKHLRLRSLDRRSYRYIPDAVYDAIKESNDASSVDNLARMFSRAVKGNVFERLQNYGQGIKSHTL